MNPFTAIYEALMSQISSSPTTGETMRLGTANIKNFPDMAGRKVQADGKTMGKHTVILGCQEIDPNDDDFNRVLTGLRSGGGDWNGVHRTTHTPIFYNSEAVTILGRDVREYKLLSSFRNVARPRVQTSITASFKAQPELPPFSVINLHAVPAAYNALPGETRDGAARRLQWDYEWKGLQNFIQTLSMGGTRTVFVMGDFNRADVPKPVDNFRWLVGPRLDRIGCTTGGNVHVTVRDTDYISLNSDHTGYAVDAKLTGAHTNG